MHRTGRTGHLSARALLGIGVSVYAGSFIFLYRVWLEPVFGYLGFTYSPVPLGFMLMAWAASLAPVMWLPIALRRPSMVMYWVIYLMVYVPSAFVPFFVHLRPPGEVTLMLMALLAGFWLMGLSYGLPLFRIRLAGVSPQLFWAILSFATAAMAFLLVWAFRSHMQLVSMEDIYDHRAAASELVNSPLIAYSLTLLTGMAAPYLMALGLVRRRLSMFGAGAALQLLVYACIASKAALSSILFTPLFYWLVSRSKQRFGLTLTWGLAGCLGLLALAFLGLGQDALQSDLAFKAASVLLMRAIGIPGQAMAWYQAFFATHPHTWLSHVHGVNVFVDYPYGAPLGYVVGGYYGSLGLDANGSFWATDGLAAFGTAGILLISAVCGAVLWVVDSIAENHSLAFCASALSFSALLLSNVSLFTVLLSGGLIPLSILFLLMPHVPKETQGAPPRTTGDG